MTDIRCRVLTAKDTLDYRRVRLESLKLHPECFGADYQQELKRPKLYFEQLMEEGSTKGLMLGAFYKSELVGLCGLITSSAQTVEIIQMYVSKDYRGSSVGLKLLSLAKHCLKDFNARALVLSVFRENISALKTYQSAGFIESHRENELLYLTFNPSVQQPRQNQYPGH